MLRAVQLRAEWWHNEVSTQTLHCFLNSDSLLRFDPFSNPHNLLFLLHVLESTRRLISLAGFLHRNAKPKPLIYIMYRTRGLQVPSKWQFFPIFSLCVDPLSSWSTFVNPQLFLSYHSLKIRKNMLLNVFTALNFTVSEICCTLSSQLGRLKKLPFFTTAFKHWHKYSICTFRRHEIYHSFIITSFLSFSLVITARKLKGFPFHLFRIHILSHCIILYTLRAFILSKPLKFLYRRRYFILAQEWSTTHSLIPFQLRSLALTTSFLIYAWLYTLLNGIKSYLLLFPYCCEVLGSASYGSLTYVLYLSNSKGLKIFWSLPSSTSSLLPAYPANNFQNYNV